MNRNGPMQYSGSGSILPSKRQRIEDEYGRYGEGLFNGSGARDVPSRVLMVQNLKENIVEADLVDALSNFGPVSYVSLTGRGVALVEFEDLAAAERCLTVSMNSSTRLKILGQPASFSYSPLQIIPRQGWESDRPNNICVMYVQNPKYPINPDVINAICKPICNVCRIIINRENGIQCLVEFADVETAKNVKQRLNGCDIYSGCCTLKIEFAKLARLNVTRNDPDQADYITPATLDSSNATNFMKDRPALLQEPPVFTGAMGGPPFSGPDHFGGPRSDRFAGGADERVYMSDGGPPAGFTCSSMPDGCGLGMENAVICIYGTDQEKFNCDKLFNILCQYGNVVRIKFLKSRPDTVMVQMGDTLAAQRVIDNLNRTVILGAKISVSFSRQVIINEMRGESIELADKTPSYKDFTDSRLNRFLSPELAVKNRMCRPTKELYFYHTPPRLTSEQMTQFLQEQGAPAPANVTIFEAKTESRSSAGIAEFESEEAASDALLLCNHLPMHHESSKFPFIVKLTFAASGREAVSAPNSQFAPPVRRGGRPGRGGGRGRGDRFWPGGDAEQRGRGFGFRGGRGAGDVNGQGGRGGRGGARGFGGGGRGGRGRAY